MARSLKKCVIDRSGVKSLVAVPRFRPSKGAWTGGDSYTLYAVTDKRTGKTFVRPGDKRHFMGVDPEATVRIATKAEAEEHWQTPLHSGWKVACEE